MTQNVASTGVRVRQAVDADVDGIHQIFLEVYGEDYPYRRFYDVDWLKRAIYNDSVLTVVAEDTGAHQLVGTASIVSDVGAQSDLLGEFGRLAVLPHAKGRGIGSALMNKRIELSRERLHVAIVENRAVHPFSQRISERYGFSPAGLLPLKHRFGGRESMALYVRHFAGGLELRRNHPRVVPEARELALGVLDGCGLPPDAIVDEQSPVYAGDEDFEVQQLSADGYPLLLRIERGRVQRREVFGALSLNHGFFKLRAKEATYLVARPRGSSVLAGAVGFTHAENEQSVRVFELIAANDAVIPRLLTALLERAEAELGARYLEIDVSAYAPRLQRTLIERGFLPVAYLPAMVFHDTERLDVVRMARVVGSTELGALQLTERAQTRCRPVLSALRQRNVLPQLASAASRTPLLSGLSGQQLARVMAGCGVVEFPRGQALMRAGEEADALYVLIRGEVSVLRGSPPREVGRVGPGEVVGEHSLLTEERRTASAVAESDVVAGVLSRASLSELTRRRPDVAVVLYKNLGIGLGQKLRRISCYPDLRKPET